MGRSIIQLYLFIQFGSLIIHQFKPENSFGLVQIGVRNQSLNKGGSKSMSQIFQYEVWSPSAPNKLFTIDDFIDGDFYTKKR